MQNKKLFSLGILTFLVGNMLTAQVASAAILFQDDTFEDIYSEGIIIDADNTGTDITFQLGNDGTDGQIKWNDLLSQFEFNNTVDITGGLSANGAVNFSGSTQTRIRETATVTNGVTACSNNGEVIVQTSTNQIYICTNAGTDAWQLVGSTDASTLDGLDSTQFLRSDASDSFTSGTLTFDAGTTLDVNGAADFSGSTGLTVPLGAANPGTCSVGQIFFNTGDSTLYTCTATDTWSVTGSQDFESVYATDADKILTTSGGNFTINAGAGTTTVNSNGGIGLNSTGTIGVTGGVLNFAASAGAFALSGTAASNITTTGATSDINLVSGRNITFDDSKLAAAIQLTNTATAFAATLTGGGIIDNINSYTLTTLGDGASNVGVYDSGTNLQNIDGPGTVTDLQDALNKIDGKLGSAAARNDVLIFAPEYPDVVVDQSLTGKGKLESLYDATEGNYYEWTTKQNSAQNGNLKFKLALPTDFVTPGTLTLRYRTADASSANNAVTLAMKDSLGTSCGASAASASTSWATISFTPAGCTLTPGTVVEFAINMMDSDSSAGRLAEVGKLTLNYTN